MKYLFKKIPNPGVETIQTLNFGYVSGQMLLSEFKMYRNSGSCYHYFWFPLRYCL